MLPNSRDYPFTVNINVDNYCDWDEISAGTLTLEDPLFLKFYDETNPIEYYYGMGVLELDIKTVAPDCVGFKKRMLMLETSNTDLLICNTQTDFKSC